MTNNPETGIIQSVHRIYYILLIVLFACIGCEVKTKQDGVATDLLLRVDRYDVVEAKYLTSGDFSALQQMNTGYPTQTRMLIEDVLRIGFVNEPQINAKFLNYFQDSTLQRVMAEVDRQYADMDDINTGLSEAFGRLKAMLPEMKVPSIYTQIGAFDQSIVVNNGMIGISLDKYLGKQFPSYYKYYPESQREQMSRSMIVPDCVMFYVLSLFPASHEEDVAPALHDMHIGKIQWVTNKIVNRIVFEGEYVSKVDKYMRENKRMTVAQLLRNDNCLHLSTY